MVQKIEPCVCIVWRDKHLKNCSFATEDKKCCLQIRLAGQIAVLSLRCGATYSRLGFDFMEI